jgi:hypothetical protein
LLSFDHTLVQRLEEQCRLPQHLPSQQRDLGARADGTRVVEAFVLASLVLLM